MLLHPVSQAGWVAVSGMFACNLLGFEVNPCYSEWS